MTSLCAEGELEFSSVEGTRLQLIARPQVIRLEASDLRSMLRSWQSLRRAGVRPLRSAGALARRFDAAFEVCVAGRTVGCRSRGERTRMRPQVLELIRVISGALVAPVR